MPEEQYSPMLEVYKVIIDALRKQAFSVVLLVAACVVMGFVVKEIRNEGNARETKWEKRMDTMDSELKSCNAEKSSQAVRIATLEERLSIVMGFKKR